MVIGWNHNPGFRLWQISAMAFVTDSVPISPPNPTGCKQFCVKAVPLVFVLFFRSPFSEVAAILRPL